MVYLLATMANFCFALGGQFFTHYTRKFSASWMNWTKALVGTLACALTLTLQQNWHTISLTQLAAFVFSGIIGLGIGDILLLKAFRELGPGRTLMVFGLQPLIMAPMGALLFGQPLPLEKFWAILFFIGCLLTISYERMRKTGHWDLRGTTFALGSLLLDSSGIIISRLSFDLGAQTTGLEGSFYRLLGASLFFVGLNIFRPIHLTKNFLALPKRERFWPIFASFIGTFLSLYLYFSALKLAHLASLSGVAITGTLFASLFECLWTRKAPTKAWFMAFGLFLIGMKILLF